MNYVTTTKQYAISFLHSDSFMPVMASVLLHAFILIIVGWGWESSLVTPRKVMPNYVEAKLVALKPTAPKKAAPKKIKKSVKKVDLAAQRHEQERLKQLQVKKQRQIAQKKKATEALKVKQLADKKAKALAVEKAHQLQEEQNRLAEQQILVEQQQQQAFADALAEEELLLQAELDAVAAQSFSGNIRNKVQSKWSRPPSARNGMKCLLKIQLIPTGEIIDVSVIKGSGNSAFDRSAEQAVKKAERFDLSGMESRIFEKYFRQFNLEFNPQDLRQ